MPINCPLSFPGPCDGCPQYGGDQCGWHFPPMPLRDLLTPGERIDMLEEKLKDIDALISSIVPRRALVEIRKDLNNTTGMLLHFQEQFNDHIAPDKRKKLQKQTKDKGGGTVDV